MNNNVILTRFWASARSRGDSILVKVVVVSLCLVFLASGPGYAGKVVWSGVPQIEDSANLEICDAGSS